MLKIKTIVETKTFAGISEEIAQVCFASLFIESFVKDKISLISIFSGISLSILFWSMSIIILRKIKLL